MKHRFEVLLDDELHEWLDRLSQRPGASKTGIVIAALKTYMSRGAAVEIDEVLTARLDKLSDEHGRFARNQDIVLESLGLFIHHQLSVTTPLPAAQQVEAQTRGQKRFATFLDQVGRRVNEGRSLAADVLDRIRASSADGADSKLGEAAE